MIRNDLFTISSPLAQALVHCSLGGPGTGQLPMLYPAHDQSSLISAWGRKPTTHSGTEFRWQPGIIGTRDGYFPQPVDFPGTQLDERYIIHVERYH